MRSEISHQDLYDAMTSREVKASKVQVLKEKILSWLEKKWEAWMKEVRTWE